MADASGLRSVIASGGTGALGRAVVAAFLAAGDRVTVPWVVAAERDALADAEADAVRDGRLVLVEADAAEEDGAATVARAAGEPAVLVNGVGGFAGGSPVHETDLATWDHLYRINVRTAVALARAVVPGMRERGRGAVVNVAAQAAGSCPPGVAAYSASKAAVAVLTRTLQAEVADRGLRVNAVAPLTIDTPANRKNMPDADRSGWTAPADIARVVLWLAGDDAAAVRGAILPV